MGRRFAGITVSASAAALLGLSIAAAIENGTQFLAVHVLGEWGVRPAIVRKVLPGATVTLHCSDEGEELFASTDGDGIARFRAELSGRCTIVVSMPAFEVQRVTVDMDPGARTIQVLLREYRNVSLMQLLTTPERYDDLPVLVDGYFSYEEGVCRLYLAREYWSHVMTAYSALLEGPICSRSSHANGRYLSLWGIYQARQRGDRGESIIRDAELAGFALTREGIQAEE